LGEVETYLVSVPLTRHRQIVPARLDRPIELSERDLIEEPTRKAAFVLDEWTSASPLNDRSNGR
jgi:hypothetical protein